MSGIQQLREKYPEYNDLSDTEVAEGFRKKYYSDIPKEEYLIKMGIEQATPSVTPESTATATPEEDTATATEEDKPNWFERAVRQIGSAQQNISEGQAGAARIVGSIGSEALQLPATLATAAAAVVGADETIEAVQGSDIGQTYTNFFKEVDNTLALSKDEKTAAELASLFVGLGIGSKLVGGGAKYLIKKYGKKKADDIAKELASQGIKATPKATLAPGRTQQAAIKTAEVLGGGTGIAATAVQIDPEAQFVSAIIAKSPELQKDYEKAIAEGDYENLPTAERYLLNVADTIANNLSPEIIEAAKRFQINDKDTVSEKVLKRWGEELGLSIPIYALLSGIGLVLKGGVKEVSAAFRKHTEKSIQAVEEGKVTPPEGIKETVLGETPTGGTTKTVTDISPTGATKETVGTKPPAAEIKETEIIETPTGEIRQRSVVVERLAKINTGLGRLFASKAALPDELFEASLLRETATKGYGITIKKQLKDLQRLQKSEGASDESLAKYVNERDPSDLSPAMVQKVDEITTGIKNNEAELNKLLGLRGKNKIGISVGKDGVYFTRTFEANNNTAYLRKIKDVLKDKSSDAEFVAKIANARQYFLSKGVKQDDVDGVIEEVVTKLAKEDKSVINDIFGGSSMQARLGEGAAKVLRARKNLDRPILDLLGEISEPYKKLSTTLLNQNKLLSEIKFLKEVEGYAKANAGKEVTLPGLFPMLPSVKTTFKQGAPFVDGVANLGKVADEAIGKFGGSPVKVLQDIYTSPQMGKYINNGLEIFNSKGKGGSDFFAKAAALAQAKETILDAPAYMLNLAGGVQGLIANGHMLNPRAYRAAVTELNTLGNQLTLKNPKAIKKVARLRELGVLDQDLVGEMINKNVNRFGSDAKNAFGRAYVKGMQKMGNLYGQPDVYTKLIAFESELASLKKVFPKATEDELFVKAAKLVRDTMTTYGIASPAARALSRVPYLGNYVLFPAEVIRTTKNMVKYAATDIKQGIASGNGRQVARGMAKLTGLGVTAGGVDAVVSTNNEVMGVSETNRKAMNVLAPDWAKGSINYYLEPFVLDETGKGLTAKQKETFVPYIRTRYIGSSSADAFDYLKSPVRLVLGKLLGSGTISDSEIDDAYANAASTIMSPYTSPKFAAEAVLNVITGINQKTKKPIYDEAVGATIKDKMLDATKTFLKGYEGGSVKIIQDYIKSKSSEELLGIGNAQRDSGFPINPKDLLFLLRSGVRPVTANVTQAMGYNMSKDLKALAMTKDNFIKEVTSLPFEVVTDEALDEVVKKYADSQERKYRGMQDFAKKVNEFKGLEYIRRYKDNKGKIQEEDKVLGIEGVLGAATNNFWYKGNDALILPLASDTASTVKNGVFMPDNVFQDRRMLDAMLKRGFTEGQLGNFYSKISDVFSSYVEKPLVVVEQKEGQ
jgi:hypothetical protein